MSHQTLMICLSVSWPFFLLLPTYDKLTNHGTLLIWNKFKQTEPSEDQNYIFNDFIHSIIEQCSRFDPVSAGIIYVNLTVFEGSIAELCTVKQSGTKMCLMLDTITTTHLSSYTHTCTHTHTQRHTCMQTHTHTHTHTLLTHTHTHTHTHAYKYACSHSVCYLLHLTCIKNIFSYLNPC